MVQGWARGSSQSVGRMYWEHRRCPFSGGVVNLLGCHLGAGTAKGAPGGGGVGASLGKNRHRGEYRQARERNWVLIGLSDALDPAVRSST